MEPTEERIAARVFFPTPGIERRLEPGKLSESSGEEGERISSILLSRSLI